VAETKNQSEISDSKLQEIISKIHTKLFSITGDNTFTRPAKYDVLQEMKQDMLNFRGKDLWGFDTGWETLNKITRGIAPQQLWVIGAYTSIGKSWFSLVLAANLIKNGTKVLYLSTEMSEKRLMWRLATILTHIPEFNLIFSNLPLEDNAKRQSVFNQLQTLPIEFRSGIGNVDDALFEIRKGKTQGYCDVVIVDFLQNLAGDKDEYQELSNAVRKLQNLALRENIGIVLASQNNRESQKAEVEALYGFKGSGTIEQAADIAIVLSRVKANDRKDQYMLCDILKNRNGMLGQILYNIDLETGVLKDEGFYDKEKPLPLPIKSDGYEAY
jgi:replicative DNA helicase